MKKTLIIAATMALATGALAGGTLYNNADSHSPLEPFGLGTHPRPAGGWFSQISPGGTLFGTGAAGPGLRIFDDFTITDPAWSINNVSLFAYTTGATTVTATGGNVFFYADNAGAPAAIPSAIVPIGPGGTFTSAAFTDIYRVSAGSPTLENRRVQKLEISMPDVQLTTGTYWIGFQYTGTNFTPVLSSPSAQIPGNALQDQFASATGTSTGASWFQVLDGTVQAELPFIIEGTVVPEPGTFIAIGVGLAGLALARRRK